MSDQMELPLAYCDYVDQVEDINELREQQMPPIGEDHIITHLYERTKAQIKKGHELGVITDDQRDKLMELLRTRK